MKNTRTWFITVANRNKNEKLFESLYSFSQTNFQIRVAKKFRLLNK